MALGLSMVADGEKRTAGLTPDPLPCWPVVIIGGGLAGCAAAAQLAREGWQVMLVERDTFPRDKICGEFLSGESRGLLAKLGCLDEIMRYNPPEITQVRFISGKGKTLEVPLKVPALGISRVVLDEVMFNHARRAGAHCLDGYDVIGLKSEVNGQAVIRMKSRRAEGGNLEELRAEMLLSAYGRRSKLDRQLNRSFLSKLDSSMGIKLRHGFANSSEGKAAEAALASSTEMYLFNGGYCGIALIEGRQVNVCMLLSRKAFSRVKSVKWDDVAPWLARENPALGRRLAGLVPADSSPLTVSQMPFSKKEPAKDGMVYIGDAAAMIAPLCGDGMAMALESGILAVECMSGLGGPSDQFSAGQKSAVASRWEAAWSERFSTRLKTGRVLQRAVYSSWMAEPLMFALRLSPPVVTRYLAEITRG